MSILESAANYLKEKVGKSKLEAALSGVTSDENWNADPRLLFEIADHSHNYEDFNVITKYIWKKLQKKDQKWRVTLKTLGLIEYLLKNGSSRCLQEFKDEIYLIQSFQEIRLVEGASDRGAASTFKEIDVKGVLDLLKDSSKLEHEREAERKLREKMGTAPRGYGKKGGESEDISKRYSGGAGGKYDAYGPGGKEKKGKKKGKNDFDSDEEEANRKKFSNIGSYDPYGRGGEKPAGAAKAKKEVKKEEDFVVSTKDLKPVKKNEDFMNFGEPKEVAAPTKGIKRLEKPGDAAARQGKQANEDFLSWDEPQPAAKPQPAVKKQEGGDIFGIGSDENGNEDEDFFKDLDDKPVPVAQSNNSAWGNPITAPVAQPQQQNIPFSQLTFDQPKAIASAQPTQQVNNTLTGQFASLTLNPPMNQMYGGMQPNIGMGQNMIGFGGQQPMMQMNYPTGVSGFGTNVPPVHQIAAPAMNAARPSPQKTISMNPTQKTVGADEFTDFETAKPTKQVKGFQDIESDLISLDGLNRDDKKGKKPVEVIAPVENTTSLLTTKDEMDKLFGGPTMGGMMGNQPPTSGFVSGGYGMQTGGYGSGMGTNPFSMNTNYGMSNNNPAMGGMGNAPNFGMGFNPNMNMYQMGAMGGMNFQR